MKGQTQALTAVLITSVTIGAVATAYIWGMPLLEKRQSQAAFNEVERGVFNLHDSITSVSRSGPGTQTEIELTVEDGRIEIVPDQDYISVTSDAQNPPYPPDVWTLIRGQSLQNLTVGTGDYAVEGEDLPGVVAVKTASGAGASVVEYRVEFRNMYTTTPTGAELRKIDLVSTGRTTATGDSTIILSHDGTAEDQVTLSTGEQLPRTKTMVNMDIQ